MERSVWVPMLASFIRVPNRGQFLEPGKTILGESFGVLNLLGKASLIPCTPECPCTAPWCATHWAFKERSIWSPVEYHGVPYPIPDSCPRAKVISDPSDCSHVSPKTEEGPSIFRNRGPNPSKRSSPVLAVNFHRCYNNQQAIIFLSW